MYSSPKTIFSGILGSGDRGERIFSLKVRKEGRILVRKGWDGLVSYCLLIIYLPINNNSLLPLTNLWREAVGVVCERVNTVP